MSINRQVWCVFDSANKKIVGVFSSLEKANDVVKKFTGKEELTVLNEYIQ